MATKRTLEANGSDALNKRLQHSANEPLNKDDGNGMHVDEKNIAPTRTPVGLRSVHHLDQIQRSNLDFDMDKVCSVTLWTKAVYACLVCGKFFQGKGRDTPLYKHSLETGHLVAMSLSSGTFCSMPDGQIFSDPSLEDIEYNLKPTFTESDLAFFRTVVRAAAEQPPALRDFHGNKYFPGLLGMNDLQKTDYINSTVQALARVTPIREFYLVRSNWEQTESRVARAFGELMCQLFSKRRFKSTLSPNELVQAIASASNNRFQPGHRNDAKDFAIWFLNEINKGSGKAKINLLNECFQGEVRVETTLMELRRDFDEQDGEMLTGPSIKMEIDSSQKTKTNSTVLSVVSNKVDRAKFIMLTLDVPTNALFTDAVEGSNVLPHATLPELLSKFDGVKAVDVNLPGGKLEQKRFLLTRMPKYLMFHLTRFNKTDSFVEKNRALVTLPLTDLDMSPFVEASVTNSCKKYNLVASVCHDGGVGPGVRNAIAEGSYKAEVYHPPRDAWYEMDNLNVKHVDMPQLVAVAETYLAFYERQD